MRRLKRFIAATGILVSASAGLAVLPAAPASASCVETPDTGFVCTPSTPVTTKVFDLTDADAPVANFLPEIAAADGTTGSNNTCHANLTGSVTAYYEEMLLVGTQTSYLMSFTCPFTLDSDIVSGWIVAGNYGTQAYTSNGCPSKCNGEGTGSQFTCQGGPGCSGSYTLMGTYNALLPSGYTWVQPGRSCVSYSGGRGISCNLKSNTVQVQPEDG